MSTQTAQPASPFLNAPSYEASPEPPRDDELTQALALEMTSPFLRMAYRVEGSKC